MDAPAIASQEQKVWRFECQTYPRQAAPGGGWAEEGSGLAVRNDQARKRYSELLSSLKGSGQ
jgi:hypothetical protein